MNGDQIASLAYLGLLLAAVGSWFFVSNRKNLGKTAQMAVIWGLIFLGVIAAKGLWDDIRRTTLPMQAVTVDGQIELPRAPDGHYYAVLEMNNVPVEFVVDTGATQIVLTDTDAKRIGLDPDSLPFLGRAETANGTISTAFDDVNKVKLGPYIDENVRVSISRADMGISLLGMSYLQRFDNVHISNSRLVLSRSDI